MGEAGGAPPKLHCTVVLLPPSRLLNFSFYFRIPFLKNIQEQEKWGHQSCKTRWTGHGIVNSFTLLPLLVQHILRPFTLQYELQVPKLKKIMMNWPTGKMTDRMTWKWHKILVPNERCRIIWEDQHFLMKVAYNSNLGENYENSDKDE